MDAVLLSHQVLLHPALHSCEVVSVLLLNPESLSFITKILSISNVNWNEISTLESYLLSSVLKVL